VCRVGVRAALTRVPILFFDWSDGHPFARVDGGFAPSEAVECPHAAAATYRAEAMSKRDGIAGALAFSRRGNPDLGDFDEAEILRTFGDVPKDFRDA
jgi:hypothetical protein